ncbi:MAG: NAD-dependent epimerase/dehydratase family protein [Bdellovibrionales bacterium]
MKVLVIGGNRFVGLRLSTDLDRSKEMDLSILNRTGQVAHVKNAAVYKGDRAHPGSTHIDLDWDVIVDFACYNERDALSATRFFRNVGRYIFISTASVYDYGAALRESDFDPRTWARQSIPSVTAGQPTSYQDGKRRAESVFMTEAKFPVVCVRFPFILGPDDYTRRLEFHVERIQHGQPLFIPNLEAVISMIHAEDACRFLRWSMTQNFAGPLNVASPKPIKLNDLIRAISSQTGKKAILVDRPTDSNRSPYSPDDHFGLDCSAAKALGFSAPAIMDWLPDLIDGAMEAPSNRSKLH